MNTTYLLLGLAAAAVALGLVLVIGSPETVATSEVAEAALIGDEVEVALEPAVTQYWESVGTVTASRPTVYHGVTSTAPCSVCGMHHAVTSTATMRAAVTVPGTRVGGCCETLVSGCGQPARPAPVPVCSAPVSTPATRGLVAGCGQPVSPCARPTCSWPEPACGRSCVEACGDRPGINRNAPACVDECGFVQLHSTARQPICSAIRFEWAATRGRFVDPRSSDPVYFAPMVHMPSGEDVAITLTITDPYGGRYDDHIRLHVRNVR